MRMSCREQHVIARQSEALGRKGANSVHMPRIEAEAYDRFWDSTTGDADTTGNCNRNDNVDIQTTTDVNGGVCNIGWTAAGEWLEYDIVVPSTKTYDIVVRLASALAGKYVRIVIDGGAPSTNLVSPASGWQVYGDVVYPNQILTAGNHTLRVQMVTGDTNFNYIDFVPVP